MTIPRIKSGGRKRPLIQFHFVWMLVALAQSVLLYAQSFVDPSEALAIWNFDQTGTGTVSQDLLQGTPMLFQGGTALTASGMGRSGLVGDRAIELGTTVGDHAVVSDTAFMALLNQSNLDHDKITVVFWQKWNTAIADSSTIWFTSSSSGNRGLQAHVPWGDNSIVYDHSGCCTDFAQRLSRSMTAFDPAFDWQTWHHVAIVKDGGKKQVWINGKLFSSQISGAVALNGDWTNLLIGRSYGSAWEMFRGRLDDFAIFGRALNETQIQALANGSSPSSLVVAPENRPPTITPVSPLNGSRYVSASSPIMFTVSTVSPNTIQASAITFSINGNNLTSQVIISGTSTTRNITYPGPLPANQYHEVRVTATDQSGRTSSAQWDFDTSNPASTPPHPAIPPESVGAQASQSTSQSEAGLAIDGNRSTYSATQDLSGSYWQMEWPQSVPTSRVQITAPSAAGTAGLLQNTRLRLFNMEGQIVHESLIPALAPGGTWAVFLPEILDVRMVRIDLPSGQTNGQGGYRIAVAEVELFGDPSPPYGALDIAEIGTFFQTSTSSGNAAILAADGDPATSAVTQNLNNSYWQVTLDRARPLDRIEITNSATLPSRLAGLTLRVLDPIGTTLATTTLTNPGSGATWSFDLPAGIVTAKSVRVGLENNSTNGAGDRVISFADIALIRGTNHALNQTAYMTRLHDSLPVASLANDGNTATHTETYYRTVDGWWECDLGSVRTLHSIRCIPFDAAADQQRLTHATVRLYDNDHQSIFSRHLGGTEPVFNVNLPGPVHARYVRIGLENKERTSPVGTEEWYLRLREVQAFGSAAGQDGILSFTTSSPSINAGQNTTLQWSVSGLRNLILYPNIGPVGPMTLSSGQGNLSVSPTTTTEYQLVGTNHNTPQSRFLTVVVNGQLLSPVISEFCADNQFSLTDGYGEEPDWIEIRNPNSTPINLGGYGLSDDVAVPFKWTFPTGTTIDPHAFLVVMASGRNSGPDSKGFLHTSFSLAATGESVILTSPSLGTVDSISSYPAMASDLSYGRDIEGVIRFLKPTPGLPNIADAYDSWLLPPVFSHTRGLHATPFALTLSNPNSMGQVFYSLDGSEPQVPYTIPIPISATNSVRATIRNAGSLSPRTSTHTYLFRNSVLGMPEMDPAYTQNPAFSTRLLDGLADLPAVCLTVLEAPEDFEERESSVEIIMPDGSTAPQVNAGLVNFGGAWLTYPKKSYRIKFRGAYGSKRIDFPFFRGFDKGLPANDSLDSIELSAGNQDMVDRGFYMAGRFVDDTMLEMGSPAPHGRFVHVFINGSYRGQYQARERFDEEFLSAYYGGKDEDYVSVKGNDNVDDNFVIGTPEPPHNQSWENARANRSQYAVVKDLVDIQQMIDFMLLWFYGESEDEFRSAGPIATTPGIGFKFWHSDPDGFLRTSALNLDRTANLGPGKIFGALVAEGHPDFKILLADRIHRHFFNNGALTPARNTARLDSRMDEIRDSLVAECARWGYRTPANWEAAAEEIRIGLFPTRTEILLNFLKSRGYYPAIDAPILSQHGGSVPTDAVIALESAGTIHYTTDGTDPRLPGGALSPAATTGNGTSATRLTFGSPWKYSALGSIPAANWASSDFDDSGWPAGSAPLGYGNGTNQSTTLPNGITTAYFRKSLNIPTTTGITGITLSLKRDDGAVVYINGTEVARSNMAPGAVNYSTLANATVEGNAKLNPVTINIPASALVSGNNLIAVEVHQVLPTSSDLFFDLQLATTSGPVVSIGQNLVVKARTLTGGVWSALTEAGFRVTHPLRTGTYLLGEWAAASPANSTPSAMRFMQSDLQDPPLDASMDSPWTMPFNLTTRSRINGIGTDGISLINTDNVQTTPGAGFVGAAVLSLDTTATSDIQVTWRGGTVNANTRDYGIRLQYRIGDSGPYLDVPGVGDTPVEYLRNTTGHSSLIGPVTLPAAAENKPLVELRWKYYYRGGTTGARAQLRLDDIQVSAGPIVPESLHFLSTPRHAQAGAWMPPVTVEVRNSNGALATAFNGTIALSSDIPLGGTNTATALNGVATFSEAIFINPGLHFLQITSSGLPTATAAQPTRVLSIDDLVVPLHIQGMSPENILRVPFASLLKISHLLPGATYRYATQFVGPEDTLVSEGAGNMILAGSPFVRCVESPRFLSTDQGTRHGIFTTAADGTFTGWFLIEPTGNERFTPGAAGQVRIHLNDGEGGQTKALSLTSASPVLVLPFGTSPNQGSAVRGISDATAGQFLVFHDDPAGSSRPIAVALVEESGILTDSATWAPFYVNDVVLRSGHFGTIFPNNLPAGIRHIEIRSLDQGNQLGVINLSEGSPLTALMTCGTDALALRVLSPSATPFELWRSARFDLASYSKPAISADGADPDGDGMCNILERAFGGNPNLADPRRLPRLDPTAPLLSIQYLRAKSAADLTFTIQQSISPSFSSWTPAVGSHVLIADDGIVETWRFTTPATPLSRKFLRIGVQP